MKEYRVYLWDKEDDSQIFQVFAANPKIADQYARAKYPGCEVTHIDEV